MRKGIPRRLVTWIALLQVLLLCVTFASPVSAATTKSAADEISVLTEYRIVRGDEKGNLNLDKPITRAEMITIMVRAVGADREAAYFTGLGSFRDVKASDWFAGYINYGAVRNLVKGDGTGYVRPNDQISWAEALTLLLRVVEREPVGGEWPTNVLLTAAELGLVPAGVSMANVRQPAVRGRIFESLSMAITTLNATSGRTYIQEYIDSTPPSLSINEVNSPVKDAKVTISGTTSSDAARVNVNGQAASLNGTRWSATINLNPGKNQIEVVAEDLAGNRETERISVERSLPVARIEISGPARVAPNSSATYTVKAFDNDGKEVALTGATATVQGNIGVFSLDTGKFMAAGTPGKGKIVVTMGTVTKAIDVEVIGLNSTARSLRIRPINNGLPVSFNQDMSVSVEVLDASGQVVTDDYGRSVALSATGITGLSVSPTVAQTVAGVATFTVRSSTPGTVNLIASSSGLGSGTSVATFSTNIRIVLTASPTSLQVGTNNVASRITATLMNEKGQPIPNDTGNDIRITLSTSGTDGTLTDPYITIYRGLSNSTASGDDGLFTAGATSGTATITGAITTGQSMTVAATTVAVSAPNIGSAAKWDMIYPPGNPDPNTTAYFTIRMADANGATVPANFAFQLEVSTSNNEPKTNGIPQGVQLFLSGQNVVNPVTDGIAEGAYNDGNDVIVRTVGGMATFTVRYDKVGQVNVKVIGMPGTNQAYGSDGSIGAAVTASGIPSQTFSINFTTAPTAVMLRADSALGNDKSVAAVRSGSAQTVKLRAYLTNGTYWVPGTTGYVTLEKVSGTSTYPIGATTNVAVVNGKVEFTVTSTGQTGTDVYRIIDAKTPGNQPLANPQSVPLSVVVQDQAPGTLTVLAAHGVKNGVPSGGWYVVAPDDTHLQMDVAPTSVTGWAVVNVYQPNYPQPFFTSEPVDLSTGNIRISIPKSSLPTGKMQYQVTLKNAVGETNPRVLTPDQVTNSGYTSTIDVTAVRYDRVANRLYIYGSGFGYSSATNMDIVNTHLMSIQDASLVRSGSGGVVPLGPATVVSLAGNTITLDVSALAAPLAALSGPDVTLSTSDGWYVRYTGEIAKADTGAVVTPMAKVEYVTYDRANRRLVLTGSGFSTGTLNPGALKLQLAGNPDLPLNGASPTRISDMEWSLGIGHIPTLVTALDTDLGYTLAGDDGWFYDTSSSSIRQNAISGVPVYERVLVSGVTYDSANKILTIHGSGFSSGSVIPNLLKIVNTAPEPDVEAALVGTWLQGPDQFTDSKIMIQLTSSPFPGDAAFKGSNLYITGNAGWLVRTVGGKVRIGAPIPLYVLLLPPQI